MICVLCGHLLTTACGRAAVWEDEITVYLCHGDDHDCYKRWTVFGERFGGVRVQREKFAPDLLSPWLFGEVGL